MTKTKTLKIKTYNYKRIAHNAINRYCQEGYYGDVVISTKVEDINALALEIKKRAPKLNVYYECNTNNIILK